MATPPASPGIAPAAPEREPLPLGVLPNLTDTNPPPMHPDTVTGPPAVVDVPHCEQKGAALTCTMGNWTNLPTSYAYQWQVGGHDVGDNAATYTPGPGDAGKAIACIVTATNDLGSSAAPASNAVMIGVVQHHAPPPAGKHG